MLSIVYILSILCGAQLIAIGAADDSFIYDECGIVINDENEARECLNLTNVDVAPLPVVLKTTITEEFVCEKKIPLYSFQCTLYGNNLIWYFNGNTITGFHPSDSIGRTLNRTIQVESRNVYNVTALLTHVSKDMDLESPLCVSTLTVQPYAFNESQYEVIPFNVSCQTFCKGYNRSQVCQTKHFDVAATPSKPTEIEGSIQNVDSVIGDSVASVKWFSPENENETTIDYYELILNGPNTSSTTVKVNAAASLPYKFVLPEGNFTIVSVRAVDTCGQTSEPSRFTALNVISANFSTTSSPTIINSQQQTVTGLATSFPLVLFVVAVVFTVIVTVVVLLWKGNLKCEKHRIKYVTKDNEANKAAVPTEPAVLKDVHSLSQK